MFQINLFYEQQQLQRERDYDPVRLTIIGGILILLAIGLWASGLYLKAGPLRAKLSRNETDLSALTNQYANLLKETGGKPTDFEKIHTQAQALHDRIENRVFFATQIDILRDTIPTNCQVKKLTVTRSIAVTETTTMQVIRGEKKPVPVRKTGPVLDMVIEVITHGKSRLEISEIRDNLEDRLHNEPRFHDYLHQVKNDVTGSNWNDIVRISGNVPEPGAGGLYIGQFEFKMSFALKDQPRELN